MEAFLKVLVSHLLNSILKVDHAHDMLKERASRSKVLFKSTEYGLVQSLLGVGHLAMSILVIEDPIDDRVEDQVLGEDISNDSNTF